MYKLLIIFRNSVWFFSKIRYVDFCYGVNSVFLLIRRLILQLSEYEMMIASQLVEPSCMTTSWKDVAGLSSVIRELRETLILPIQQRSRLQASKLIQPPKGMFCSLFFIGLSFVFMYILSKKR